MRVTERERQVWRRIRVDEGRPPAQEVSDCMLLWNGLGRNLLTINLNEDSTQIQGDLETPDFKILRQAKEALQEDLKDVLEGDVDVRIFRAYLSAIQVYASPFAPRSQLVRSIRRNLTNTHDHERILSSFTFNYDLLTGFDYHLFGIARSISEVIGYGAWRSSFVTPDFDRASGLEPSLDRVDDFLSLSRQAQRGAALFRNDFTGFELSDKSIPWIRERVVLPRLKEIQPDEYLIAGAELARDSYKFYYQKSEGLFP